jgi:single-strand DNA-binding protein
VLQRFRGELTLLDGRAGGGEQSEYQGGGSDFGRSSPLEAPRGGGQAARPPAASSSYAADLDDDIPF